MSYPLQTRPLGQQSVAEVILGQSPPSSAYNDIEEGLPFYQGKADFGLLYPTPRMWCTEGQKFAKAGDILISVRAPVGDVNIADGECVIGRGLAAIRAGKDIDPWFLYFALLHCKSTLEARATGSTFASINKTTLHDLEIPFFELLQQSAIGSILRFVVGKLQDESKTLECALELKQATMQQLFTRGLRGEPQKETEIGLMPESWSVEDFDSTLEIAQGQVSPRVEPYASMMHIGPENIEPGTGFLLPCKRARDQGLISGKYYFKAGEIVYSKIRPYLNKVAMPTFEGICSADMYPFRSKPGFEIRFLFQYLLSDFFLRQAVPHQLRTGIPKINREQLASTKFPKPTPLEQREIAQVLDAIDQKMALHKKKQAVLEELFRALLHKLMTGELSVNDLDLTAIQNFATSNVAAAPTEGSTP